MPYSKLPPLYGIWCAMRYRCQNPNERTYDLYGGRGITVCERWSKSFQDFVADIGPRPSPKHSLDRIDVNGSYEPGNCRWATQKQQCRNMRKTIVLTIEGQQYKAIELAEELGVKVNTVVKRAARGLTLAQIKNPDAFPDRAGLLRGGAVTGRLRAARTHCKHGHEFTPGNTHVYADGSRMCKTCNRLKVSRYKAEGRYGLTPSRKPRSKVAK